MVEENMWKRLENLNNAMKKVEEFEKRRFDEEIQRIQVRKEKEIKLNPKAKEFKREKLPKKYIAKILYRWDDKKFDKEYLKKLKRNWNKWKNKRKEREGMYKEARRKFGIG